MNSAIPINGMMYDIDYVKSAKYSYLRKDVSRNEALIWCYTAIVLFINDQVYNYQVSLYEAIVKSKLNRQEMKRNNNSLKKEMRKYNSMINRIISQKGHERYAEMLSHIEEDCAKHLEIYKFQISQHLLNNGITGDRNLIASLASTIDMLCQTSSLTIQKHYDMFGFIDYDLRKYELKSISRYANIITNDCVKRSNVYVNLNEVENIKTAYNTFINKLLLCAELGDLANKIAGLGDNFNR